MPSSTEFRTLDASDAHQNAGERDVVRRAHDAARRQPIDEHRWARWGHDSEQSMVLAVDTDRPVALALVTPTTGSQLDTASNIDLVVDPTSGVAPGVVDEVVERATTIAAAAGPRRTQLWVHEASDGDAEAARRVGLLERRDVHQLRVPLPLRDVVSEPITTRSFVVGVDEAAWLEVNAAAFSHHSDQGSWTIEDLREREAEPWFDPDDFLLVDADEGDGRVAGFNWTKVHDNGVGEIYVIGVHPDFAGRGLGRRLCVAGLEHLAERVDTGMLYVDADNAPAMGLYLSLGFTIDHTNTAFAGAIGR